MEIREDSKQNKATATVHRPINEIANGNACTSFGLFGKNSKFRRSPAFLAVWSG
jgi:hypothetical protein